MAIKREDTVSTIVKSNFHFYSSGIFGNTDKNSGCQHGWAITHEKRKQRKILLFLFEKKDIDIFFTKT